VPLIQFETPLYLAEWDSLLARLRELQADIASVWLVGHNPGLHELAIEFGRYAGMRVIDSEIGRHFPTASRASFSFDVGEWSALPSHNCRLSGFVAQR